MAIKVRSGVAALLLTILAAGCMAQHTADSVVDEKQGTYEELPDHVTARLDSYVDRIIALIDFDYELWVGLPDIEAVMARYLDALEDGRFNGYTPVIIVPSDYMAVVLDPEILENDLGMNRDDILELTQTTDARQVFETYHHPIPRDYSGIDVASIVSNTFVRSSFGAVFYNGNIYPKLILAKIPTTKPWEVTAWIPMGGDVIFPMPHEQAAVYRYWYEAYGAQPAVVDRSIWELYVARPIEDMRTAMHLADEHEAFCESIVWPDAEGLVYHAAGLLEATVWSFWWD